MQDRIGGAGHAMDTHCAGAGMKQGQHFRRAIADVLVRLAHRLATGLPTGARIGLGLIRPRFVLIPDRQAQLLAQGIGVFDQFFFASASGSTTVTGPLFRLRTTWPVWHQLRDCCQVKPASNNTVRIVSSLTVGRPSAARRRVRHNNCSDHVAVPSCSAVGCRRTSVRMRSHSAAHTCRRGHHRVCARALPTLAD